MKAPYSIAGWLTSWFFVSCCILMGSASTLLYWSLAQVIHREDVSVLSEKFETLQSILSRRENAIDAAKRRIESEWAQFSPEKIYVRLRRTDGSRISISPNTPPGVVSGIFDHAPLRPAAPERLALASGRPYLASSGRLPLGAKLAPGPRAELIADVALDLSSEETILPKFRDRLLAILLFELVIAYALGRNLARISLDPVKKIAARASGIGPSNLHERIGLDDLPAELLRLVSTFNAMLDRLSESFARLSRFSSDIAHELRTPINNMRGEIEIALNKVRSIQDYEEVLASSLEELERITQITDTLLFLAKCEDPQTQLDRELCNLKTELSKVAEFYETISSEAGVHLEIDVPDSLPLFVNRTLFDQAAANLIANAVSHTPSGGKVTLRGSTESGSVKVEVEDTGRGIPPEHLSRVFDRFYRVDPSRAAEAARDGRRPGFGLGLAIVHAIVHLHSGQVTIESEPGRGTRVCIRFPDNKIVKS